ncbi:uncharacterized protein LOC125946449 [Dermacentor silvarum]|uniref:uncharacterized protein LOC125946449 n=1 Tax=Dermacentor silvarum TaxID=543639 RepID=UPI002100DC54|nr:uncharacterized protein LOC125946449 [Dermacentor silvarum]
MSRVPESDPRSPGTPDEACAKQQLEEELQRLTVDDEPCRQANRALRDVVGGILGKVDELLASPALLVGTAEGGPNADPLLSYLEAERKYFDIIRKRTRDIVPPLQTRGATSTRAPSEDDSDVQRLVAAVLEKGAEFRACSQEKHCAKLVGLLTEDYSVVEAVKPWSASEPRSAERPTQLDQILGNVACSALPRLIESSTREWLSEVGDDEDHDETSQASAAAATASLPKDLAGYVRVAAALDMEQARCASEILDLRAEFEKRAAVVRELLAQQERLRRVQASWEQHERLVGKVTRGVSDLRDHLASRVKQCESLIAVANAQPLQEAAAECLDGESAADHGAALDKRCAELTDAAALKLRVVEEMQRKRESMSKLADKIEADLAAASQGSLDTWCDGVRAETRRNVELGYITALFVEFHTDPRSFLRRMRGDTASDHAPAP